MATDLHTNMTGGITGNTTGKRRSIFPETDDSWASIARREMPKEPPEQAMSMLQSWNLHVFMRPAAPAGSPRHDNPILPSDIIFVEAPLAIPAETP